ncbi:hypothetical protein ZWY2020_042780 [Hordeum vulgare]|nr:hypothetical protein ZWY2020_042780 [Hordeum vulgare]
MDVIWGLPEQQKMQIITMWWLWWQERNKVREGAIPCIPDVLAHRVKCTTAEYMACSLKPSQAPQLREGKWSPPADGIIKINSDGAYAPGEDHGGWGIIARTSQGEVVAARSGCSDGIHDPFTAELKSMEEALNLAAELGVIRVEFETDAQLLAMALDSKKPDCSSEAAVIEDIKIQCHTWFSSCQIRFGRRGSNQAAHALAKEGMKCNVNHSVSWEYEVPACANVAVMGDSTLNVS